MAKKGGKLKALHKPPSDITMYDDEAYVNNPLLSFRITDIKQRRHYSFLKKKAAEDKIKLCRNKVDDLKSVLPVTSGDCIYKMRECIQKLPVPKMLIDTEAKIRGYVPVRLKEKYPDIVRNYMAEVHEEYDKRMKAFSLKHILAHPVSEGEDPEYYSSCTMNMYYKYLGKTPRYNVFLQNRKRLKKDLLITQPFILAVLQFSEIDFPDIINDFSSYNDTTQDSTGSQNLANFIKQAQNDVKNRSHFLKWVWYPKIIVVLKKHIRKRTIENNLWPKAFSCIKGLINRQINELKIRTLEHLIQVILDPQKIPRFKLNMECENGVDLNPNYEMIEEAFCDIVHEIANVATQLENLETQLNLSTGRDEDEFLKIELNQIYLNEIVSWLKNCLKVTYKPVIRYLEDFRIKYFELYSKEMREDLELFLSEPREFEEYFEKLTSYSGYVDQLRAEVQREFFQIAVVNNAPAVKKLREMTEKLSERVVRQIVVEHMREESEICKDFEAIRDRALKIPKSTEELLAGADYMIYVKTQRVFELQNRLKMCLKIGSELMSLTELTKDHIDLQITTINWLSQISLVMDQNASMHEAYKMIFEEHLMDVVKKLKEDLEEMLPNMSVIDDMSDTEKFRDYYILLQNYIDQLKIFADYVTWINKEEKLFKMPQTKYPILDALKDFVYPFAALMKMCIRWLRYYYVWMDGPFEYLEPRFVEETTEDFYKEFQKNQKYYRTRIKQDMIGTPVCKFRGQTEDPDPEKHPVPLRLCAKMLQWIKDFRIGVFIVRIMCNSALRKRHWIEMSEVAGFDITPDAGTTLRKIINYGLDDRLESFEIISVGANKELQLQQNLAAMIKEWEEVVFPYAPYKNTGVHILSNVDDIQALLDDHYMKVLTMRGSAFMKPCEEEVLSWYYKVTRVNATIEQWGKVQASFLYLLPIFSSKDIVAQMPEEGRLFVQVETTYHRNMDMVLRQPLVMETGPAPGLLESLEQAVKMLDDITNGVNVYLEKKRLYFPRFFFLSNDEMLEILSETKDPLRVQPHLSKCFEGIHSLVFNYEKEVLSMTSGDSENIKFVNIISTKAAGGSVEKWLLRVEEEMLIAVQNDTAESYADYMTKPRIQWVLKWAQMVVLCVSQIFWAADVHASLQTRDQTLIRSFFADLNTNLNDIVSLIRSPKLSNLDRITIKALIVIDVHAKDSVEELIKLKISSENDFQWLAQLRYYWEDGKALVRIINATVEFANEYLGNSDRLVITPLTDRCYRTLVGAYQLHLNGAPEGPAGTGKTETTKDLAKALAVQCKVFNCSDGLDYIAMGKYFKGQAASGAWSCLDEFNRIELEVLSVIAQQILTIIQAVRAGVKKFVFEGTELNLNPSCYVCITMNPGYAGRSELPDNLKVLFRSVAMMVPDYAMIGEISLYSFGFVNARSLSVKIVTTYRLCSEQLSSQNHYDYGMRAVKSVLSACGNIKSAQPDENEDILLLRCLLDVNLPKFLSFDIPLFEGIISDLFPGIVLPPPDYTLITKAFNEICAEMNLQPKESFLIKIVQTYEMMIVRHGFMIVGSPMAGKSCTLKVLAKVLTTLKPTGASRYYQDVQMAILNPKAITMGQLYGEFDPVSYEWRDGIVACLYREFATSTSPDRKWLIFDGPVDAVWIENMNTVLDDNKKLCLTSGEVVTMTSTMSMIFEVMDLSQASPATVSRCGMIYMEATTLGWETFARSWINQCDSRWGDEGKEQVFELFAWLIPPASKFVRRNCSQLIDPGEFSLLRTTFELFEMCLKEAIDDNIDDYGKYLTGWFQATMLFAITWGIGGILNPDSRARLDVFHRMLWSGEDEEFPIPEQIKVDISMPGEGLISEYVYMYKQKGAWKYWPDLVKKIESEETPLGFQVPTIDTGRYVHLLEMHIRNNRKLLFVGPTGTGKSFYTQNILMTKLSDNYIPAFITFTAMITANQTQDLIISKLVKLKRGTYGPPKGKICIIFVDDMNMPTKEKYGAQPPLELLRQYFDQSTWYDIKDTSVIYLKDMLILCACGLPGGSRQDVYARFLAHFNIFSINTFSEDTMYRIFVAVLMNGFKKGGHGMDVLTSVSQIVSATQQIYRNICADLRPTPAKSHYIFNLRDISRVCTGCALLKKESVDSKKIFARLWYHEAMRVFYDRLVDEPDQLWMFQKLNDCLKDHFKEKPDILFENYLGDNETLSLETVNKMIFGCYLDEDNDHDDKKYEEIASLDVFYNVAMLNLDEYNSTHRSKMDIVLFRYALQHLNKLCRILSIAAGSALLVGIGGSGRQSLTKLASAICGESLYQPEITKNYGMNDWWTDIKNVLKESGGTGKDTVFLMTENQIKMERFVMDIDCLLNQGEVPNIFPIDEKQEILEMVRLAAQGGNRNIDVSPLQVFSFFVNRCKQRLHIILCFSPIGAGLRTRVRLYPSLVNCCTIDWFQVWPDEALRMVAVGYMEPVNVPQETKISIISASEYFHSTASKIVKDFHLNTGRIIYITAASFLELIRSYQSLIARKQTDTMTMKMRYVGGLETLQQAAEAIGIMQVELTALQPKLAVMAENSRKMMENINYETIAASAAAEQVKRDEIVANAQAQAAQALKDECEKDLAQAIPVLEEAIGALNTLKPADITLVKSMKNPPAVIKTVMAAVCVIKGLTPDRVADPASGKMVNDYWGPSKRLLGDMNFLQALKDFDKDNINPEIMKRIRKEYIPLAEFKPEIVAKASSAAEGLCKWIIAMDLYDAVAKIVAPKKAKLAGAEKEYADTMEILNEKRQMAEALERKVAFLNEELEKANAEMKRTQDEVELCQNKLQRALALIDGLGGEKSRWTAAAISLQGLYDCLPGDILISCAAIAYLAALTAQYRVNCISDWANKVRTLQIPSSEEYSLITVLGSEIKIQAWNLDGLPRDAFSAENAIIMDCSSRFSLFIDPQGQANKWIKNMERSNHLKVVKFTQGNYMKIIETSLELGHPVLIENIYQEVEVALDPILNRNTFFQGGQEFISIGDNIVLFHPRFKLYMTSAMRNPHFVPETFNKVTIINFALTQSGLEDQLLSIVVAKERPDLQELRQALITEAAKNRALLKEAEDKILYTLSVSGKDILSSEEAIKILDDSKMLSVDIKAKQAASVETEQKIDLFREKYKPVAAHSSVLYYSITDLPNIDPMYQFSLNWYINLYMYSIDNANKSRDLERRLKFLVETVTINLYNNVCRAIFEKDKLLYSFILTTKIMIAAGQLELFQLLYLLKGGETGPVTEANADSSWISEKMWDDINYLEQLSSLKGFVASFKSHIDEWHTYYDYVEPQLESLPSPWEQKTSRFEKIIILKALRPDKVYMAIAIFITKEVGVQYISPPPFDIAKSFMDANCLSPLVFILSPGADPMGALLLFAEKMGFDETFQSISLGQGQGPIAQRLIEEAQWNGTWVCLQNCHLAASWMGVLEVLWEKMDMYNTEPSFRLWLTSYPSELFPVPILQNGVKMTNEPPTGLQQNLIRSYNSEPMNDEKFYKGCPEKDRAFTRLLYGICFFHAVVQERRKFGPLGWNIPYGFNESDFQISVLQLQMFLNQYEEIPYAAIAYLTGECNYGGRVTDFWDRRSICTILLDFVNADVVHDPKYQFANDEIYILPRKLEHREVVRYIEESIPTMPPPEAYGLHSNAGITRDQQTTNLLLYSMFQTQGSVSGGAGADAEKVLYSTMTDIQVRLPKDFDIELAKEKYPVDYNESMNTVLVQEMERFAKLLTDIRKTCGEIKNGVKGIIVMTPELEEAAAQISFKAIPTRWKSKSYPSLKPLASYIQDFLNRLNWLQTWFEKGKPPTFWLSGFFFTQAFLTGAMQNYARKYRIPIDTLTFDFLLLKHFTMAVPPEDGVYVNGLYIEGARWNLEEGIVDEQLPKILIYAMPVFQLVPTLMRQLVEGTRYKCPLYKTTERRGTLSTTGHSTNYVLPFLLPTKKPAGHWVKRSAAMMCQTGD